MEQTELIKIAYADDHELMRKGVIELVSARNSCTFIIEANNGEELIQKLRSAPELPDICMLDIIMPVMDGFATITAIREEWPDMKILILTGHNSDYHLRRMIIAGANGYLLKNCAPSELVNALQSIHDNGIYHSDTMTLQLFRAIQDEPHLPPDLTGREEEFLKLCCSELKYDEIAAIMCVSKKSVDWYRTCLFKKFKITSRSGLVLYAIQLGLVPIPSPPKSNF